MLKNANFEKAKKNIRGGQEEVTFAKPNICTSKRATPTLCTKNDSNMVFFTLLSTFSKKKLLKNMNFGKSKIPFSRLLEADIFAKR